MDMARDASKVCLQTFEVGRQDSLQVAWVQGAKCLYSDIEITPLIVILCSLGRSALGGPTLVGFGFWSPADDIHSAPKLSYLPL